jgi:hypothetical protein
MKASDFSFRPIEQCPAGCLVRADNRLGIVAVTEGAIGVGWLGSWEFETVVDGRGRPGALFGKTVLAYKHHWSIVEEHRDGVVAYGPGDVVSFAAGTLIREQGAWMLVHRMTDQMGALCWLSLRTHALGPAPLGAQAHFARWRLLLGDLGPDAVLVYET